MNIPHTGIREVSTMKFEINEKTFKAISESTGALSIKEVICTS